ncbi:N-acetylmuramoyl-L-alanine amidase [Cellulomonas sp. PhB143]|uniref:N-acetylmuramoyl-L-alanine amidase n=1 Tax=Cellulomonas sp. PhB143 TaxID=2485186 RepID=UPI000F47FA00|nr:N-acetylmuramoyl-L-alanine amidase [Cellulomonas sp. PhB143]ROS78560.1 N-acetylmuramoyl-L-alanine amidase [Cellulomonas sp. PhB143]
MRKVLAAAVITVLAGAGVVVPVVNLPVPEAHAVAPTTDEVTFDGVDTAAADDATALEPAEVDADIDATADQPDPEPDAAEAGEAAEAQTELGNDAGGELAALSPLTFTGEFLVAGVTWDEPAEGDEVRDVAVRVHEDDRWSDWTALEVDSLGIPGERGGTQPVISPGSDGVQARVVTASGKAPAGLRIDVIDPGESAADELSAGAPAASADAATGYEIQPSIVTRARWGADERLASSWPTVSAHLKVMYVHHTAGSNSYSRSDSASIVRGIYAYHTKSRGWPDIGYQFLVDRYGTVFQGRKDAISDNPLGAQAGGYNTETIGVSAMGNFQSANPPAAMVRSIEKVLAWKAYQYGIDPQGRATLTTGSSSVSDTKAAAGKKITVRTIQGHRDTNQTSCPGAKLYAKLGGIRHNVDTLVDAAKKRYGSVRYTTAAVSPSAPAATQAPMQEYSTTTYSWRAVSGAVKYQLLERHAAFTSSMPDGRTWTVIGSVKSPKATITTSAGLTRVVAARPVDAKGRLGPVAVLRQTTRPVPVGSMKFSPSYTKVSSSKYYWGSARRSTSGTAYVQVSGVRQARQVVIVAPTGPGYGRLRVTIGGSTVGTVSLATAVTHSRTVLTVPLSKSMSGTVRLSSVDSGKQVRVSAVAFPRTAAPPGVPGRPKLVSLASSQTPVQLADSTTFRWSAVNGALRYEVYGRKASHGATLPGSWTRLGTTTRTSYTQAMSAPGTVWVVAVRAVGRTGAGGHSSYPSIARPLASTLWQRSGGAHVWGKDADDRYYRNYAFGARNAGSTITVRGAQDVRRVRVIGRQDADSGRIAVYVGGKRYGTIDMRGARDWVDGFDVVLPRATDGTVVLKSLDDRVVRVSAIALAHR